LFTLDPTLAALFTGDMRKQERKLMSMIGTAVNSLDQLDSIVPAVKALGGDMRITGSRTRIMQPRAPP
jgi:hypothetical protein